MSVEQWAVLALVVLLPLLDGVARLRRKHAGSGGGNGRVGDVRTSQRWVSLPGREVDQAVVRAAKQPAVSPPPSLPSPLPLPVAPPAVSFSRRPVSRTSSNDSASVKAHTTNGKSDAGHQVVSWLRPVHNLRRAIVMATILGPPRQ